MASPLPPRRLDDREVFRRPACPHPTARTAPASLGPSQGFDCNDDPSLPARGSPPGVHGPFDDMGGEVRIYRGCLPGAVPSARFVASSTGTSLTRLAVRASMTPDRRRPGVPSPDRRLVRAGPHPVARMRRSLAAEIPAPRALRNTWRNTSRRLTDRAHSLAAPSYVDAVRALGRFPFGARLGPAASRTGVLARPLTRFPPVPSLARSHGPASQGPFSAGPPADLGEIHGSHGVHLHQRGASGASQCIPPTSAGAPEGVRKQGG
jgi:hypothetical protein